VSAIPEMPPAIELEAPPADRPARRPLPRKAVAGVAIVGAFALIALCAPVLAPYDPDAQDVAARLQGPSASHPLGTDQVGRDELSRLIYATRVDLPVSVLAVLLPALLGTLVGSLAGYYGRWVDTLTMRVADVVQAFPIYVFLIALVFALGAGIRSILIAFTVIGWVVYARLVRGEILRIRDLEYVQAATLAGLSRRRVLVRHVLPNALRQTVVYMSSDLVLAMVSFSALSYFGLGVAPPTAEWGSMIADGQEFLRTDPQLSVFPGVAIVLLGTGFVLIGDGLDDHLRQ